MISLLVMMDFVRQNINFLCIFRMHLNFVTAHLCDARWPSHNFYGVPPRPSCFRQPVQRVRNARSYSMPRWHLYSFVSHPFFIFLFLPSDLRLQLPPRGKSLSHSRSPRPPFRTWYGIIISDHVESNCFYNTFYEIKSCHRLDRQRFKNYTVFLFVCQRF